MTATRFVGHSIKRLEDRPLLTGAGRFVADLRFADMLEAAFVRSPHAHAELRAIDVRAAQQHPGVHAVFTLSDLMPCCRRSGFRSSFVRRNSRPI